MTRSTGIAVLAITTVAAMLLQAAPPAAAASPTAGVEGTLMSSTDGSPLTGARLHLGDPQTGQVHTSEPVEDDGRFRLDELTPATYEVAVEQEGNLFVVSTPVSLAPGQTRTLHVAVQRSDQTDPSAAGQKKGGSSFWNNPFTASLVVVGSAIVLGVIIDKATDDDDTPTSPS